jgi:hypothetical protein
MNITETNHWTKLSAIRCNSRPGGIPQSGRPTPVPNQNIARYNKTLEAARVEPELNVKATKVGRPGGLG